MSVWGFVCVCVCVCVYVCARAFVSHMPGPSFQNKTDVVQISGRRADVIGICAHLWNGRWSCRHEEPVADVPKDTTTEDVYECARRPRPRKLTADSGGRSQRA